MTSTRVSRRISIAQKNIITRRTSDSLLAAMSISLPFSIVPTASKEAENESLHLLAGDGEVRSTNGSSYCQLLQKANVWLWTLVLLAVFVIIVFALNPAKDSDKFPISLLNTGDRIQLKSVHSNLFVRVSDATSSLVLDQTIPWNRGSTFDVEAAGECFVLRSLTGKYVRVDDAGVIRSSSQNRYGATHFSAVTKYESSISPVRRDEFDAKVVMQVHLKVCNKNRWLQEVTQLSSSKTDDVERGSDTSDNESDISGQKFTDARHVTEDSGLWNRDRNGNGTNWSRRPSVQSTNVITTAAVDTKAMSWGAPTIEADMHYKKIVNDVRNFMTSVGGGRGKVEISASTNDQKETQKSSLFNNGVDMKSTRPLLTAFDVIKVPKLRGVNLGGWFIPEVWMASDFFNGTGLGWGGSLCAMVNYSRSLAEERMAERLSTFITEEDLRQIKAMGFNSVRLPIGYWNLIQDPYRKYAPSNHRVSLRYIDWCFDMCERIGLTVLLDLHGAPGSQNGIDHSGCSMYPSWVQPKNVALSLQAIEAMAMRYGGRKNLVGFELLNEPAEFYGVQNHTALNDFYVKSYKIIRKYDETALVVFNELYPKQYAAWNKELREPNYYNIVVDWHLYQFQFPHYSTNQHIAAARAWEQVIETYDAIHPVIVGEWSMGTGALKQAGQPYVDAAVKSFERSSGWYLWTWKVQPGIGFDEWDVQAQHEKKNGLDPLKEVRDLEEENLNFLVKDKMKKISRLGNSGFSQWNARSAV